MSVGAKRFGPVGIVNSTAQDLRLEFALPLAEDEGGAVWDLAAVVPAQGGLPHRCVYFPVATRVRLLGSSRGPGGGSEVLAEGVVALRLCTLVASEG